ncbi:hypothetical protein K227x_32960 [Rubripirellula lacrimiformis]|uniref:Uncharacterized protein n=1 Tax=Rubripirellula lacrimiformis TaxID=1930273 RepID=A0A517NCN9_9BACT|nr:hypothetical protein K227x_32960 [Rubripirellula lacrimiformis]
MPSDYRPTRGEAEGTGINLVIAWNRLGQTAGTRSAFISVVPYDSVQDRK